MRAQGFCQIIAMSSVAGERVRRSNFVYGSHQRPGWTASTSGWEKRWPSTGFVLVIRPGQVRTTTTLEHWKATGAKEAPFTVDKMWPNWRSPPRRVAELIWACSNPALPDTTVSHIPRVFRKLPSE